MKMFRLSIFALLIIIPGFLFAQKTHLTNLDDFDKVILDKRITEITLQRGGSEYVELTGVESDQVEWVLKNEVLTINLKEPIDDNIFILIRNNNLKRIEAGEDSEIFGAQVLSGGSGKYYVMNFGREGFMSLNINPDIDLDINIDIDDLALDIDHPELDLNPIMDIPEPEIDIDILTEIDELWKVKVKIKEKEKEKEREKEREKEKEKE